LSALAPPREIRWGIVGPGFIAGLFAEDLARTPGARCMAVASRDVDRARDFAERYAVGRHYGTYAALANDPDIDIVYVATPHSHHFEHARLMLEGGKAVMVEKPFTIKAGEAEQLIALARARGLFLMDAMWTLCNPLVRDLIRRVQAGDIGTPRAFAASLGPLGGIPRGHRVEDPSLGGSFMLECLVYPLNVLAALAPSLAEAQHVSAAAIINERGVDTASSLMLTSAAGMASVSGGFALGTDGAGLSTLQLIGTDGWLQIDDNLFNPGHAVVSSKGAPVVALDEPKCAARYRWEIEEANRCLLAGDLESPIVPHRLTLDVMRLLDRGRAAAGLRAI
jgi:predicted dehydrogenase